MKVLDPGHKYRLDWLDTDPLMEYPRILRFVKRDNPPEKYPGNEGHYPGTTCQEVLRALIDRMKYVDNQISDVTNEIVVEKLRWALYWLEYRAAERHGRKLRCSYENIEDEPTCPTCGHLECEDHK